MTQNITIKGKTKPENPKKAVKYDDNQWGYVSPELYDQLMVGNTYTVDLETTEKGYKVIRLPKAGAPAAAPAAPAPSNYHNGNGNGNSNAMTKADWAQKDILVARQAVMKSCLESPALAEAVKVSQNLEDTAANFFRHMWGVFNGQD